MTVAMLRARLESEGLDLDTPDAAGITLRDLLAGVRDKPAPRAAKGSLSPGEAFYDALSAARRAQAGPLYDAKPVLIRKGRPRSGIPPVYRRPSWRQPFEDRVWARIPASMAAFRFTRPDGTLSAPVHMPRDQPLPAARFWPGGRLPDGIELADPNPVYTGKGDEMMAHMAHVFETIHGEGRDRRLAEQMLDQQQAARREEAEERERQQEAEAWQWDWDGDSRRSTPF